MGVGVNANVHNWNNGQLKPAIDLYTALGPLTWRVVIDRGDWESEPVPGSASDVDWSAFDKIYSTGKMADLWNTIRYITASQGQTVILSVMGGVPTWMGGTRVNPDKEDYWVRTTATMIAYGKQHEHLDFHLVSPANEIDSNGIEGPQIPPDQYTRLLHKIIQTLDAWGINDIRFVAPDTADTEKGLTDYLQSLVADPLVAGRITAWGIHSYTGDLFSAPPRLSAGGLLAPVVVTEYSAWCADCDQGAPNPNDAAMAHETARQAVTLLAQGASGLEFYDAWDGYYEHHGTTGHWGALAVDLQNSTYTPRRTFGVVSVLERCARPGYVQLASAISGEGAEGAVVLADPQSGGVSLLVLGTNKGGEAKIRLSGTGTQWSSTLSAYGADTASPDASGRPTQAPTAALTNGTLEVSLQPGQFVCYTGARP